MILYRSNPRITYGHDYSEDYTVKVVSNNELLPTSCVNLFTHNPSFNSDIIIGNNVCNIYSMLYNCKGFGSNIFIKGNIFRNINSSSMFHFCNNELRKNIFFNSVLNNCFNSSASNSIVGYPITWSSMTNGFYNSTYNVYCYYNYGG